MAVEMGLVELSTNIQATLQEDGYDFGLLGYAIACNNLKAFDFLLAQGLDVNLGDSAPLELAVKANLKPIILQLIQKGADVNKGSKTPLSHAIEQGSIEIVSILIANGADVDRGNPTPLLQAVNKNNYDIAAMLIENGCIVDKASSHRKSFFAKVVVVPGHYSNSMKTFYQPETDSTEVFSTFYHTPLYQAVQGTNIELVRLLLLNDADPCLEMKNQLSATLVEPIPIETPKKQAYSESKKLIEGAEKIKLAKEAFLLGEVAKATGYVCAAYESDTLFLIDYLTYKIHQINLDDSIHDGDFNYILKFIRVIHLISKEFGGEKEEKIYQYLQENLLLELNGHDCENPQKRIKLFRNHEEKKDYIKFLSVGASWENTFLAMQGNKFISAPENGLDAKNSTETLPAFEGEGASSHEISSYSQANLIKQFGINSSSESTNFTDPNLTQPIPEKEEDISVLSPQI